MLKPNSISCFLATVCCSLMLLPAHVTYAAQLSGSYQIDASLTTGTSTSFGNFASALAYLTGTGSRTDGGPGNTAPFGVSGPVVFHVAAGTYQERVQIDIVPGASPVNTITFDGGPGNAATRIISYGAAGSSDRATVQIYRSRYVTLSNLTIRTTGTAYGWGIHIMGNAAQPDQSANGCKVKHCTVDLTGNATTSWSTDFTGIIINNNALVNNMTGQRIDSLEIDSNTINYGAHGITHVGGPSGIATKNKFRHNTINNSYEFGLRIAFHSGAEVRNNTITMRPTGGRAIYLESCVPVFTEVTGNRIVNPGTSGITIINSAASATPKGLVANNIISGNSSYGIQMQSSWNWNIFHNTVYTTNAPLHIQAGTLTGITVYNNVLAVSDAGNSVPFYIDNPAGIDSMDYNLLYAVSPGNIVYAGSSYNRSNFSGAAGLNTHTLVAEKPPVASRTDLRLNDGCYKGLPLPQVSTDIQDTLHHAPPDIGAYVYRSEDNLAVQLLTQPVRGSFTPGIQNVEVKVRNAGTNTITSFSQHYRINQGTATSTTWYGSLAPCDTATVTFSANLSNGDYLTFYTSQPNGNPDSYTGNDTLVSEFNSPLSGVYTIGNNAADFPSVSDAVSHLVHGGVSGPVVFNIRSGTYTERVTVPKITGASAVNTITFQSLVKHPDSVTVNYAASFDVPIIKLENASYVNFKHITIASTSPSTGRGIELSDEASADSIINCKIMAGNAGIYGNPLSKGNHVFSQNEIAGASYGIYLYGNSQTVLTDSNIITHNLIRNTSTAGAYFHYTANLKLLSNTITTSISGTGLQLLYSYNALEISNNKITISGPNTHGLFMNYIYGHPSAPATIINNRIIAINGNGIRNEYGSNQRYYHNTISAVSANGAAYNGIVVRYANASDSANEWKNNVIATRATNVSAGAVGILSNTGINNTWDYNLYYTTGLDVIFPAGYNNWKASGQDSHSVVMNPHFADPANDLRLLSGCRQGIPTGVATDIEGLTRPAPPTMGAHEYAGSDNASVVAVSPASPAPVGLQDVVVKVKNTGTNPLGSFTVSYTVDNGAPASVLWTGSLAPCDTAEIIFTGSQQLNIGNGMFTIAAYTEGPNNTTDSNPQDDTLKVRVATVAAGTFTINNTLPQSGTNFTSFADAVTFLGIGGLSADVIFHVAAGTTYDEKPVVLSAIQGNNLYGISFIKSGTGANPLIYGTGGIGNSDAVVTLKGANRVVFDGIDLADNAGNTDNNLKMEYGYRIINASAATGSTNNTIRNCRITLPKLHAPSIAVLQSAGTTGGGVAATQLSGGNHNNRYENLRIDGSYEGILLTGTAAFPDSNNVITASAGDTTVVENAGKSTSIAVEVYGIQVQHQKNAEVSNCIVRNASMDMNSSSVSATGIHVNNTGTTAGYGNAIIKNNRVHHIKATPAAGNANVYGIRVDVSPNATAAVFNNVVHHIEQTNGGSVQILIRGISHSGNGNASYFNNIVSVTCGASTTQTTAAFWRSGTGKKIRLQNNILINTSPSGSAKHYAVYYSTATLADTIHSSNNLLWSSGTNGFIGGYGQIAFLSTGFPTLGEWRTITGQEQRSLSHFVKLDSTAYLFPDITDSMAWALNGRGAFTDTALAVYGYADLKGRLRPATREEGIPDIGAYELTPAAKPPAAITFNSIAFDTTQTFLSALSGDTLARIKWTSFLVPSSLKLREYVGIAPRGTDPADKFMYFYLDAEESGTGPYGFDMDVYYHDTWLGRITEEQNLKLQNRTASNPWAFNWSAIYSSADTARNIIKDQHLSDIRASFTGAELNHPLPVHLLVFTGSKTGSDVQLTWTTASERNNKGFEVQRSADGRTFEPVAFINGQGNSDVLTGYRYTDAGALLRGPVLYYRLKQADHNGSHSLSQVVAVDNRFTPAPQVVVYPNPFSSEVMITIFSPAAASSAITISDITGKTIWSGTSMLTEGENRITLKEAAALQSGVYFLSITTNGTGQTLKLIRQD